MAPFLTFTDLSRQELEELLTLSSAERKKMLRSLMHIDRMAGFEAEIILDFHFQNLQWGIQKNMEPDKVSTFVSVMKKVVEEIYAHRLSLADSFESFKQYLLMHSVHRPPYSVGIFVTDEVRDIKDYVLNTFYRHFKLYQFIFVTHRELQVNTLKRSVMPAPCAPLVELTDELEVNPRNQPELAYLFTPPANTRSLPPYDNVPYDDSAVPPPLMGSFEAKVDQRLAKMEENLDTRLGELRK
eukprot:GEMP01044205.1.p1 GENE.GEMP01044205.1~~GEMP01044205.1.p1  ORF type:complete len:241 (+),score=54.38 GEMP01044205.1:115-837(+)